MIRTSEGSAEGAFTIRTVAVIGAGEQGRAFAFRCARSGFLTVLEDVMPARLRRAGQDLAALEEPEASRRISFASTIEDAVREADVAIDFVPDELESKLEIFSLLDRMAPPKTVICTPTRALSVTDLGSCTYRAPRCVALAASWDELLSGPLSVVPGMATLEDVTQAVCEWLRAMGIAVRVSDRAH